MMNKKEAIKILNLTFNNDFSEEHYISFIDELIPNFELNCVEIILNDTDRDFIKTAKSLGVINIDGKTVEILSVELNRSTSVSKARVAQRNFVYNRLKHTFSNGALVAFYGNTDWRFSFVKCDYKIEKDGKISEESTMPKRYSFLVGKNEPNHTCQSRFVDFLTSGTITFKSIEEAFEVDKVTNEFFAKYKELYLEIYEIICKEINSSPKYIEKVTEITGRKNDSVKTFSIEFAKKFLGQIVFLYFIQKKGWLGVKKNENWGSGSRTFISDLFKNYVGKSFFNDVLEPLFYGALSKKVSLDDYNDKFRCRIPFLNGGLFEPVYDYINENLILNIPNELIEKMLTIFNQYNFTVKEDEPLEKEVAIDPEMLGKVFENLLDIKDRKSKGAFYTPREIVNFICQESLINYLVSNSDSLESKTDIIKDFIAYEDLSLLSDDDIKIIDGLLSKVKIVDPAVGSGAFLLGMMNELVRLRSLISNTNDTYSLKYGIIKNNLYGVDIMPSATDICKLRLWLSLIVDENNIETIDPLPNLDYNIQCGNSLIEHFNGHSLITSSLEKTKERLRRISKLKENRRNLIKQNRVVLSDPKINYEEKKIQQKRIEQKIYRLNNEIKSLSMCDGTTETTSLDNFNNGSLEKTTEEKNISEYKKSQKKLFTMTNPEEKRQLKKHISELEWSFIESSSSGVDFGSYYASRSKPFFIWWLYFNEVFYDNGGFDIVVGNPPYESLQDVKGNNPYEHKLYESEGYETFAKKGDLYCLFYEKGMSLMNDCGTLCFITSNKWMRSNYGKSLRNYFIEKTNPQFIIDFGSQKVFSATVDVNVLMLKSGLNNNHAIMDACLIKENCSGRLFEYYYSNKIETSQTIDQDWVIYYEQDKKIINKSRNNGRPLSDMDISISYGIKTGCNDVFIINSELKNKLLDKCPQAKQIIGPILRGKDIHKNYYKFNDKWIILTTYGIHNALKEKYPAVYEYLYENIDALKNRGQCKESDTWSNKKNHNKDYPGQHHWLELDNNPSEEHLLQYSKPRIMWKALGTSPAFCYFDSTLYCNDKANILTSDTEDLILLCAILNSEMFLYLYDLCGIKMGKGFEFKVTYIDRIYIPVITKNNEKTVVKIKELMTKIENTDEIKTISEYENEIDNLVFQLYNLTDEEIRYIREKQYGVTMSSDIIPDDEE